MFFDILFYETRVSNWNDNLKKCSGGENTFYEFVLQNLLHHTLHNLLVTKYSGEESTVSINEFC